MVSRFYLFGTFVVAVFLIKAITRYIQIELIKRRHGCKPPKRLPQSERIIGYQFYQTQVKASRDKQILAIGRQRYLEHGNTWSGSILGQKFFNTIEAENIKTVLATNFKDFGLGGRLRSWRPFLGQGIFTTDGAQWEHSRALVRPNFTRAQVAELETFEPHIQSLISKIPRDGSTVDLQVLFFKLTLDSATEFLFGQSVHSLERPEDSEEHRFGKAFDLAQARLGKRTRLGRWVYFSRDKQFNEACRVVHKYVDRIVYRALEKDQAKDIEKSIDGDGQERYTFLSELLKSTKDPKELRHELLNILLAGRDTTAGLLSNTFHTLARRPDIWKKLKAEVDELNGAKPTYDTLRNMKYIKYLLNESLRLYPIVPGNGRFAVRDTILPTGGGPDGKSPIFVAKGEVVAWHVWNLHRRVDIYGPDALEFRPERWSAEENLRPGWGYLPFNGGPRICVGQQFALTEASYTIVRLVQEFDRLEDRDGTEWQEQLSLTLASGKGVNVALFPRS